MKTADGLEYDDMVIILKNPKAYVTGLVVYAGQQLEHHTWPRDMHVILVRKTKKMGPSDRWMVYLKNGRIDDCVIEEQLHHDPQRMSLEDQIVFYENWAAELRNKRNRRTEDDLWLVTAGWQNMVEALVVYLKTAKALREIEALKRPPNIRTDAEVWWCWFCVNWLTDEQVSAADYVGQELGTTVRVHQHKCGHRVKHWTDLT